MKFVPTAEYTYWWPIKVRMPHPEKSGQVIEHAFEMKFAAVGQDKAVATVNEIRAIEDENERRERQHDQLLDASRDWRGVVDDDNQPLSFSRELLHTMLKAAPWYSTGVYESYGRSLNPEKLRKGN